MAKDSKNQNFKIGLYIRVSTEEQAENPEGSIRNQEDRLRDAITYKNRNGNFGEVHGVFVDPGISAKDMKRPKLKELLRAFRNKEIDLIMVTELSRLSRNTRDFIQMWDLMRLHGCRFQSLREDFNTTDAAGELVPFQLMNLAQFERRQTAERVEANIAARAARGLYNGGAVPRGYKLIPEKPGYLEIDAQMAPTVREAFAAFLREGGLATACRWLNEQGYSIRRSMQGGGSRPRTGHFNIDSLHAMLRNKAYIGIKVYHAKEEQREVKAAWPALIDELTFVRVGKTLEKSKSRLKTWKEGRMPYILSGSVRCLMCMSHMPGKSTTRNGGKTGYYEHAWATKRDSTLSKKLFQCEPHRVPAKKLEPLVWEKLVALVTQPDFMKDILTRVRKHHEANPLRKEKERLQAKTSGVRSQLDGLAERIAELPRGVSAAPLFKQMERLEDINRGHERALHALAFQNPAKNVVGLDSFEAFAGYYRKFVLEDSVVPDRKKLVRTFINKVEVGTDSVRVHFIVDKEYFRRELASKEAGSRPTRSVAQNDTRSVSQSLTIGAPGRT